MKDVDFSICPFIKNELCFLTYFDFCKNAKILKWFYEGMDDDAKLFYKWYVYANIHMDECYKNYIWEFLNYKEGMIEDDKTPPSNIPGTYAFLIEQSNNYKVK